MTGRFSGGKGLTDGGLEEELDALDGRVAALEAGGSVPTLAQGTYQPAITPVAPGTLAAVRTGDFTYTRQGDVVDVSGSLDVTPATLDGNNQIDVDLPVPTSSVALLTGQANGSSLPNAASTDVLMTAGPILGVGGKARAYFTLAFGNAPAAFKLSVRFSYRVVP